MRLAHAMLEMMKDRVAFGDYFTGCDNKASHPLMLARADTHGEQ
ncbi:hypothetical protein ABS858_08405 [Vibrio neptunius]